MLWVLSHRLLSKCSCIPWSPVWAMAATRSALNIFQKVELKWIINVGGYTGAIICPGNTWWSFRPRCLSPSWANIRSSFTTYLVGDPHFLSIVGRKGRCWDHCFFIIPCLERENNFSTPCPHHHHQSHRIKNLETEWWCGPINQTRNKLWFLIKRGQSRERELIRDCYRNREVVFVFFRTLEKAIRNSELPLGG